ncbi:hypothetical protein D3C86_1843840 [compost metagenome]
MAANPRQRNDEGGDGHNEYFSQGYIGPDYEKSEELKGKITFKIRNLAQELKAYEDNLSSRGGAPSIELATRRTGELLKAGKANPAVTVLVKQATAITSELNKDLEKPLRDVEKLETQTLFKRLRP